MYRKILVPLDGTPAAESVLPHVLELARAENAELVLLRVPMYAYVHDGYNTYALSQGYRPASPLQDDREGAVREAKKYLNKLRNDLIRLGIRVATITPEGQAALRIVECAREQDVDLIAMATHNTTRLHRMLFGNVVEEVMRGADKPILLINTQPTTNL